MTKKIFKELIISLLLCLAIILLLGILLYEYVPMTKTIPSPVSYTTPENVKQELANTEGVSEDEIIMTYEVDSTDLNNYKRIQDYKPGKANPFSSYLTPETTTNENGTTGASSSATENGVTSNNTGTSTSGNTQDNSNTSGGQFFQDKGIK
ncbi:MAG: hypothetical protein HFJ35_03405 [Clostridia bacterium]|nr:hypothetical protein [Clostridia bacterium]